MRLNRAAMRGATYSALLLIATMSALHCAAQQKDGSAEHWLPVRGEAAQLAVAVDGAVYVLDGTGRPWRRRPGPASIWSLLPGHFVKIDAGPAGQVWALDREGRIHRHTGSSWAVIPGSASDIGAGPEGSVYIVARDGVIARYEAATRTFTPFDPAIAGVRAIDVDVAGLPWVVLADGRVMRHDGVAWRAQPATISVRTFAIGPENTVMAIAQDGRLYRLDATATAWAEIATPALPVAIGVAVRGKPWIASRDGTIYASEIHTPVAVESRKGTVVFTRSLPWTRVRGTGREIAIGPAGEVYSLSDTGEVWQWKGRETWSRLPGRLARIAVAPTGMPWGIDEQGRILQFRGASWAELPGRAREIAIGATGVVWVVLPDGVPARWEAKTLIWEPQSGVTAARIAVDPEGRPWVISADGAVLRHDGSRWQALPAIQAQDIGIGPDGTVYIASSDSRPYRYDPTQREWIAMNGDAARIAVGPGGIPWAVTARAEIFAASRFEEEIEKKAVAALAAPRLQIPVQPPLYSAVKPTQRAAALFFQRVPGSARDIAIGNDGSVFAIGFNGNLTRWNNGRNSFLSFPGTAQRIAVQRDGNPWVVTAAGEVFRYDGANWQVVRDIRAADIAIGGAAENRDDVFVTDLDEVLYRYDPAAQRFVRFFSSGGAAAPGGIQVAVDGRGRAWTVNAQNQVFRCDVNPCAFVWQGARDISIGQEGTVFVVDLDRHLRRFDSKTSRFERLDPTESAVDAVAVGPKGVPWIVKSNAEVFAAGFFERDESRDIRVAQTTVLGSTTTSPQPVFTFSLNMRFDPVPIPQPPFNIAISSKGLVIAIEPGGNVYVFDEKKNAFVVNPALKPSIPFFRLGIEADGTLWGVDFTNRLLRREGTRYVSFPGLTSNTQFPSAIGIGVGAEDTVLATSPDNTLFRFNRELRRFEKTPFQYPGYDNQLSVDQKGRPWIIDALNDIYEFTGIGFEKRPGKAIDVWAGATGAVFICDDTNRLKRWNPAVKNWDVVLGAQCTDVAVGIDGRPWIVTPPPGSQILRAR